MPDVSIIYVSYNTKELTINSLRSLYQFTKNISLEIILVDNDSKDDTVPKIRELFPEVIVLENKRNVGFGQANNQAMEIAKGKYLFLLNTDTYLINNAIEILFDFMEEKRNRLVGVVGAKLFKEDLSYCVAAGPFPDFRSFVKGSFWKLFFSKEYFSQEANKQEVNKNAPYEVDYVSGADFFVRKNIIKQIGGFDKRFFMYSEETELTFRMKKNIPGSKTMIVPDARIVHIGQGSDTKGKQSKKFKYQRIKSKATYYRITEGWIAGALYYITALKRLYFP